MSFTDIFVRPFVRGRELRRGERILGRWIAGFVALALLGATAGIVVPILTKSDCQDGLVEKEGECVGLVDATAQVPVFKPGEDGPGKEFARLVKRIAEENERVRDVWESPKGDADKKPYVKVALLLPFNTSKSGAMTAPLVERSLAGAYAAQRNANRASSGVNFQMLLGNIGTDLDLWQPAVDAAAKLSGGGKQSEDDSPLVGVMGLPNSEQDTQDAASALSAKNIPAVSGVLSSPTIEARTFFKTAPNNRNSVMALARYLKDEPGNGKGFLVWDSRAQDDYVTNTKAELLKRFGTKYELTVRDKSYVGTMGPYEGAPATMAPAASSLCESGADTVFVAGRDWDLPELVEAIAKDGDCQARKDKNKTPIRILRVSTGLTSRLTSEDMRKAMAEANVVTLNAAPTDNPSWSLGQGAPGQFQTFATTIAKEADIKGTDLDDGYAIMHYDAFQVLIEAVTQFTDDEDNKGQLPSKYDVNSNISNMKVGTDGDCGDCVRGAGGEFGYTSGNGNWPVCKPVPVIEYPRAKGYSPPKAFRTSPGKGGSCPG
ncbi:ABC transporter substrate-binding protein [Streptomyces sp. NPDC050147]|uniref:ABC transporter substrate-binding protein n=1 Tax=Streptomyces sp. NPDC050147 TaxID=3155513 RepID=UPI0034299D8B